MDRTASMMGRADTVMGRTVLILSRRESMVARMAYRMGRTDGNNRQNGFNDG